MYRFCKKHFRKLAKKAYSIYVHADDFRKSTKPERVRLSATLRLRYYANACTHLPLCENTVFFESFSGLGMNDNPYAIFKYLYNSEKYGNMHFVWAVNDKNERAELKKSYPEVEFVARGSDAYLEHLATAKYIVNNILMPLYFSKREGQIFVYTWHSVTVKSLGYDIADSAPNVGPVLSNMLQADYLISTCGFMTKIFKDSYRLDGIYEGTVIEEGHPRCDLICGADRDAVYRQLARYNIFPDRSKKLIVYAPTWKGVTTGNPIMETEKYIETREKILNGIDRERYEVLIKPHQAVYKKLTVAERKSGIYIPATLDTNEVLSIVDILVSDYSSIVFDFMMTGKPTLFYIPDLAEYSEQRGIYFKPDELSGPATDDINEIIYSINHIDEYEKAYGERYKALKAIACEHDDGNACERVADCIFGGNADKYRTFRWNKTDKKKLLIYGGGLGANGVTSTLRYRLDNIDYDKFDVTLVAPKPRGKVALQNCLDFNKNIRMLIRTGYMTSDQDEGPMWNMQKYAPFTDGKIDHVLRRMFKREYMRAFGESRFDYLIDYSGYGPRFSCLFLSSDYGKKIIWQHNDLYSDMNDTEKQSQPMYKNHGNMLRSVISLYPSFDTVVSAGKGCMTQNIKSLREYFALDESTVSRMTYVPNRIGYDEILGKQSQCTVVEKDGKRYYCDNDMTAEPDSEIPPHEIPIPCGSTNFFTIGRLSNEKNCLNLLKAFAAINRDYPDTTLSFIGSGSLEGQLKKLIKKYRLQGKVLLTGQLKNPFGFASLLDCFVFPSRHEGSGMVVYEMRVMHKPVIISNYPVHRDVCCGENGQIVTDMTAEGIADGMRKYLENPKIISYNFDCAAFNAEADERFLQIFE